MLAALLVLLQVPPEEAVRTFRVADGFRLELVAAEPHVIDPVAMAFDEDGRLYVCEMRDYPSGPPGGTIRLLEDADGDGRFEKATIFAEHLQFPSSVQPWRGGVLVSAGFEVVFLKDTNGDRKADEKRTVLAGFNRNNSQHLTNGLQFGLDNWIWASNGLAGGTVGGVKLQNTDFRFRPDTGEVEAVGGNSQFGNTFDDWGRRFFATHDNHSIHAALPREAVLRHPHATPPAVQEGISDHGAIPRLFPASARDAVFTTDTDSSCAITVWRGDAYVCEPVLNLVHRDCLTPKGASFVASRIDKDSEFLASTDPWCRPVNLALGPDGALYVCDMQRAVIEHPDYIPKAVQPKLDLRAGTDRGRIFRVLPSDAKPGPRPRLSTASSKELVAHLAGGNAWWRRTAQRLLFERQDPGALALLREDGPPLFRLHALYLLPDAAHALSDPEAAIREHAVRITKRPLPDDPDPRVRFHSALLASDPEVLARLAERDGADPWARTAIVLSASERPLEVVRLLKTADAARFDLVRRLGEAVAARREEAEIAAWLRAAAEDSPWRRPMLDVLKPLRRTGVDYAAKAGVTERLHATATASLRDAVVQVQEPAARVAAIELASLLAPAQGPAVLEGLLKPAEPQEVQVAALRALSTWPGDPFGARLFEGWSARTTAVRREILNAAIGRPERAKALLDRVERGEVRAVELEAFHRDMLARHPDRALRERAKALLQPKGSADREEVIAEIAGKLEKLRGDGARGEKVFMTSCATCHRLRGQGVKVGPDLDAILGRERRALLIDLLDPNRAMDPTYQVFVARTASNDLVNGIVAAETPAAITLRRAAGEETTLLRKDLAELRAWPASLMPEGLEMNLRPQDFSDLFEFLKARP
jgi:putative membrane-bound dehydrogenase-like protein